MKPAVVTLLLASVLAPACSTEPVCVIPDDIDDIAFTHEIGCENDYTRVEAARDDAAFARTLSINWIIDRANDDRVYFPDTEQFVLHYTFAVQYLDSDETPVGNREAFQRNYFSLERRFVMGKIVRYVDQGITTLEFSPGDTADADIIEFAFRQVTSKLYNGGKVAFRPRSARHEALVPELRRRIRVVSTEDVFLGQSYQALNPGTTYGYLKFLRLAELAATPPSPTDIVVIDGVPNDIPLVSGVITGDFQTPLSHVNILSQNRGTPNMATRDAYDDESLRAYEGELVRLDVDRQEFSIEPATIGDAEDYWAQLRPPEPLIPESVTDDTELLDLEGLGLESANRIGAKAAGLAELAAVIATIRLPDQPLAIPFGFYRRHLQAHGIDTDIAALLADYQDGLTAKELRQRLFAIRWKIFISPMDTALMAELETELAQRYGADTRLRFRSSTNVEDLEEFSGAGLYTSTAATPSEGADALADAVRNVWASAWNNQAFIERDFYRVDHAEVNMAVLVHPAFEDELANGVAVTSHAFDEAIPAFFINSQVGEVSVTNPSGRAVPEQLLYFQYFEELDYEVITRSSLVEDGAPVLSPEHLLELTDALGAIENHFRARTSSGAGFAMDIEFKVAADGLLYLKQARPY